VAFQTTAAAAQFVCKHGGMASHKHINDCGIQEFLSIDYFSDLSDCDSDGEDYVCIDNSQNESDDLVFSFPVRFKQ